MNIPNIKNIHLWPLKKQAAIFALIFILVFYIGYWLDISSLVSEQTKDKAQEEDLKQQISMVISKEAALKAEISNYPMLLDILGQWKQKIIKQTELPSLLNEILKVGAANRIIFTFFNPEDAVKDGAYLKVSIQTIIVGGYHDIANFVSQIANMPKMVVIGDFTLSNEIKADVVGAKLADQANAENLLVAEMMLELYIMPVENTAHAK